jgi:hypothetical protein
MTWTAFPRRISASNEWYVANEKGQWIAETLTKEQAQVMAAAPELFDAISDLVVGIEIAAENGIDLTGYVGLSSAFAAIRKAKGETT